MSRRWIAAVVVCVLLAGCGGPSTGGSGDGATATTGERVVAPPPNGTTATNATSTSSTATERTTGTATNVSMTDATNESETDATNKSGTDATNKSGTDATNKSGTDATNESGGDATGAANESAANTTTAATYDQNLPYELRVSNAGPAARTVTVQISDANNSTVAVEMSMNFGANESAKRDFEFPTTGTYEVTVTVGDARATEEWNVSARDPDDALSVHISADGEVYLGFVSI